MLKRIGLAPSKKLQVFFISAILLTIPLGYVYNSVSVILFVLYSFLAARKEDFSCRISILLPVLLYIIMLFSLLWSIDISSTLKALSKEAALLFIPLAFFFNRKLSKKSLYRILDNYTVGMCFYGMYFLGRAVYRYTQTGNADVFFYHELSTLNLNAIYLSALFSISIFHLLFKKHKNFWTILSLLFLSALVLLLSSKTVILTNVLLVVVYIVFFSGLKKVYTLASVAIFLLALIVLGINSKIGERISSEFRSTINPAGTITIADEGGIHYLTIKEAWTLDSFHPNYHFNGTAFRVYQIRIFLEMLSEDMNLFTGYGLNASLPKIHDKGVEYDVYQGDGDQYGYNDLNFHNQYIETFADLGFFGFLILVLIQIFNLKNSIKQKDFVHIAFAILMITLFLTESFLWRQRGVVLFSVFYCLYNTVYNKALQKDIYEENTDNRSSRLLGFTSL